MESLRELYRIGRGPSSSHTMGPQFASERFKAAFPDADEYKVTLYGSLALTGKGHLTDVAVHDGLAPTKTEIIWNTTETNLKHPNTMDFVAFKDGKEMGSWRVISVGGGKIEIEGQPGANPPQVYDLNTYDEIKKYCEEHDLYLWQYVEQCEGPEIWDYLHQVWDAMKASINAGLHAEGILPGGLEVQRKAKQLINSRYMNEIPETRENRKVCSYGYAVSEENAGGGVIVTAPTCGACGVVPAALYYKQQEMRLSDDDMVKALAVAGLIGNIIKTNASISGAEAGCQAEVGSAISMAAAGLSELYHLNLDQIGAAAEIAMEHCLGLTCDPVDGLVQIPCIERNVVGAMRAINAMNLASFLAPTEKVSLDTVVQTMYETGKDLDSAYRETSEGGLATTFGYGS